MNSSWRRILWWCFAVGVFGTVGFASARDTSPRAIDLSQVRASELPTEARQTLGMIRKGGPYPYAKDASIFSNRERILPRQPRGFYREFTVKTPQSRDRGARRIVCGGTVGKQQAQVLETCYYTDDHYASFKKIKE